MMFDLSTFENTQINLVFYSLIRTFASNMKKSMIQGMRLLTVAMAVMVTTMVLFSCKSSKHRELLASRADSLIFAAGAVMNYDRLLTLTDSFEHSGDITPVNANRWRGAYYYHQGQHRMAEICFRKVIDGEIKTDADQLVYNKAARRLSELMLIKGDYDGALQIAIPAIAKMDQSGIGSDIDYAILYNNIGCCQLNLGRDKEAYESFLKARERYTSRCQSDSTSRGFQEAVVGTVYTSQTYINNRRYAASIYWIDRAEMLLDKYRQKPDARVGYFDEYQGRIEIMRAVAMQGLNKPKEAAKAYKQFLQTDYAKTGAGRINATDYLVAARRYREAAANYRYLDQMLSDKDMELSLDNIQLYMLPKYRANAEAGRSDSALVMGQRILSLLDSAIIQQKNSATAELATIYHSNEKEAQIASQRAAMSRQQMVSTTVALGLIVILLVVYVLLKRQSAHRLEAAHAKLEEAHGQLQVAYDQLEITTKAKERIESELRIARDIQTSMVPRIFPDREGLDIYASMTPAREVGGDLYDYLLQDNMLYFCVADVSGKGVPAALFMAQAIRLFRSIAKQHHSPATIATRINNELTEDNEQGMFVTMFIGLVDLTTGQLTYCNAGHNPPILGVDGHDEFMTMESNAPIGLWPGIEFIGETIDDIRNKLLLIYTDGLNEAEKTRQEQFGEERLLDILNHRHFNSSRELIDFLDAEIAQHRNGAEPNDDLTMLCLMLK